MAEQVNNQLEVILKEKNVPAENAKALLEAFGAPFTEAGEILAEFDTDDEGKLVPGKNTIVVTDEDQTDLMSKAREKRLALKRIRTGVENKRKELKEGINKAGQAIDSVASYVKNTIEPAEKYLELQEKFAETKKAERAAKLKAERIEELSKYSDDLSVYNFDTMREEAYQSLLSGLKTAHEDKLRKEKEEAERIEKERQAELDRQKELEAENARLQAEAAEKEKAESIIRERINRTTVLGLTWNAEKSAYIAGEFVVTSQEIKELNDTQFDNLINGTRKKITELADKQRKIDDEKRAEEEARLKEERDRAEVDRLEREKLEKADRERKAQEEADRIKAEEDERAALLAPDKVKIKTFYDALGIIKTQKLPAVKTKKAQDIVSFIEGELEALQNSITEKLNKL